MNLIINNYKYLLGKTIL